MAKKTTRKQPKKFYGISAHAIALVYEGRTQKDDRDVFYADNPSVYSEARLGVASRAEAEEAFNNLVDDILTGKCKTELPFLKKWIKMSNHLLYISVKKGTTNPTPREQPST